MFSENTELKNDFEPQKNRKQLLMKWREEKMLKRKIETLSNVKKKSFVVGQVKYTPPPTFVEKSATKLVKKEKATTNNAPAKRVTRASVRLAQKQGSVKSKSPAKKPALSKTSKLQKQVCIQGSHLLQQGSFTT